MWPVPEAYAGADTELECAGGQGQQPGEVLHLLARHHLAQLAQARQAFGLADAPLILAARPQHGLAALKAWGFD